jgi:NAD(P)-dependent dehydrogenase (short-subunit alcohol dehydrogenase family)
MNTPVVLITGALTGIGRATALAYAQEGAQLVISGRREALGQSLIEELTSKGAQAHFIRTDVRSDDDVAQLVDQAVARFGRIDIAINNAGTEGTLGPVTQVSAEQYASTFETNVLGTLLCLKHEMRVMLKQGSGSIVNLSSMVGQVGIAGASVYVASKHAIEGLTKSVALEGASVGVRVNAVAPGPIATDMLERFVGGDQAAKSGFLAMLPAKRAGTPEEIAQTIVFVAGDKARFLTGQTIVVDGGYTAQ